MQHRAAQTGEVEGLPGGRDRHGPRCGVLADGRERDVPVRLVDQFGVDLVADHQQAVPFGEFGAMRSSFAARVHSTRRIVRIDEDEHLGTILRQGPLELGEAECRPVVDVGEPELHRPQPHTADGCGEGRVVRRLNRHGVARGLCSDAGSVAPIG